MIAYLIMFALEPQILSSTSPWIMHSWQVFHPKESEDLDGDSLQSSHAAKRWEESRLAVSWMNVSYVSGDMFFWVATEKDGYVMYHYVTFARLLGALSGAKALTFEEELHELLIITCTT